MPMDVSSSRPSNKANIFLGLIEYELNTIYQLIFDSTLKDICQLLPSTSAFLLLLSNFISFKSVGTKEMTILYSLLVFLAN